MEQSETLEKGVKTTLLIVISLMMVACSKDYQEQEALPTSDELKVQMKQKEAAYRQQMLLKIREQCKQDVKSLIILPRNLNKKELQMIPTPYLKNKILPLNFSVNSTNGKGRYRVNKNKQAVMAFDFSKYELPKIDGKTSWISGVSLQIDDLRVIARDNRIETEMICVSNMKICSGEEFKDSPWKEMMDEAFWQDYSTPRSDFFVRALEDAKTVDYEKGHPIKRLKDLTLSFQDLFGLTLQELVTTIQSAKQMPLYMVLTDDVFVIRPKLKIDLTQLSCPDSIDPKLLQGM